MADIPGDASTTATLAVGGSYTSAIDFVGDHDWFKITLTAGQAVDISVSLGTLEDSYLNIRNSAGTIIYSNDDIVDGVNRASEVNFNPSYTGTYYVDVSAWVDPNQGSGDGYTGTGTYTVSAKPFTPPPLATNDQIANQLTSGYWGGDVHHWAVTQGGTLTVDIHTLTAAEQTLAIAALQEWSDIIGVAFQQVTSGAQIVFDDGGDTTGNNPVAQTNANWSNGIMSSANVEISKSWVTTYGTSLDSYSFQTYVHEIGHALGLGHAGNYNNDATYPYDALFQNDSWSTSIMSYFDQHENTYFANLGFSEVDAVTPMVADIIAMQNLYGLSTATRTGDTIYGDHSNAGGIYNAQNYPDVAYTIYDSGGNDTIDYSLSSADQLINLNPETFSNVNGYVGNLEIARGVVIENAIGGSGNDTLIGNSANNVLAGNASADILTGGGGYDVFSDTKSNHNGDTITDFHPGDAILFTDATLGSFGYSLTGNSLSYAGGAMTVNGIVDGRFTATGAATGGVQIVERAEAHNDFSGDGLSDLLLRNDNGTLAEWDAQTNGSFAGNAAVNYALNTGWTIAGTGDFNGDGHVDLLLRNTNGALAEWTAQSDGSFTGNAVVNYQLGTDWQIAGIGDFNADGRSDLLLRNTNGALAEWTAQADGSFAANPNANYALGSDWNVAATGDFNGDGVDDLLLRNTNGALAEWNGQSNGSFVGNAAVNYPLGTDWHIVGTGDFNGDGLSDLLLRNTNGALAEWTAQADGSFVGNAAVNYPLGTDWHIVEIGDFNGNASDDLLLRNNNGAMAEWTSQPDGSFVGNAVVNYPLDTTWHVQDPFVHDPLGL